MVMRGTPLWMDMRATIKFPLLFKMAFTTPWRTLVWVVMPFGSCNPSATFKRMVMHIFIELLLNP